MKAMKTSVLIVLSCFMVVALLGTTGCVRRSVTADLRSIPSSDLGRWLPEGQAEPLSEMSLSALYVGALKPGVLGGEPNAILYQAVQSSGQMTTGAFDAMGVMRFFRDGQVIWRFVRDDKWTDSQITAGFGDDFTGGYVGKYKKVNGEVFMHFYAASSKSTTGFMFITIRARLDAEGVSLLAVSKHRNGEFSDSLTTVLNPPLLMRGVHVEGMQRLADW